jgi:hypothetical protein
VLSLKRGRLQVNFYAEQQVYRGSCILYPGDVVLLIAGGHGFAVLEEAEMFAAQQGPYVGEVDKTRSVGIAATHPRMKAE